MKSGQKDLPEIVGSTISIDGDLISIKLGWGRRNFRFHLCGSEVEINVCMRDLDDRDLYLPSLMNVLSEKERAVRASNSETVIGRRNALSRICLRTVLADFLGCRAQDVPIANEPGGKPCIASSVSSDLRFSVTHAGPYWGVAVSWDAELGLDFEGTTRCLCVEEIADDVCTPAELRTLMSLPGAAKKSALLELWTRKESLLKGLGIGIVDIPLHRLHALRKPGEPGELRWDRFDVPPAISLDEWRIHSLAFPELPEPLIGALACKPLRPTPRADGA